MDKKQFSGIETIRHQNSETTSNNQQSKSDTNRSPDGTQPQNDNKTQAKNLLEQIISNIADVMELIDSSEYDKKAVRQTQQQMLQIAQTKAKRLTGML